MAIVGTIGLYDQIGMKAKHAGATGDHKWHWELVDGYQFSRDGSGQLVYKFLIRDREKNEYVEVVLDAFTRQLIVAKSKRLSDHQGQGSAKASFNNKPNE
jgi:hypothetical protein